MRVFVVDAAGLAAMPEAREACGVALSQGQLLIYPTDTLYAVGGLALVDGIGRHVSAVKGRPIEKALPLVAASWEQVLDVALAPSRTARLLAERFWPGPLSLIMRARPGLPAGVGSPEGTVAVRVPALALTRELCALAGPLVATSANLAGGAPADTCAAAIATLARGVALAIDGGAAQETRPSTLVDVVGETPRLLRPGAVPWADVERAVASAR